MRRNFATGSDRRVLPVAAAVMMTAGVLSGAVATAPVGASVPHVVVATPLYAYAGGTAVSPTSCPADATHNLAVECSLDDALTVVGGHLPANQLVYLATPGTSAHYLGNWTPDLTNTTAAHALIIQPAPGLPAPPVLDGNTGSATNCETGLCNDAILTASGPGHLSVSGFTMEQGNNTTTASGGAIDNQDATVDVTSMTFLSNSTSGDGGAIDGADGATGNTTVTGCTFTSNSAGIDGGAIDHADVGSGTLTVSGSTFTANTAGSDGGAIDSADGSTGGATATVTASTFTANTAGSDGGAIDSADAGSGNLTVSGSTFTTNSAAYNGGAIDSADGGDGTATISTSTMSGNTAGYDGGGIDNGDDSSTGPAALVVKNATLTGNTATLYDGGGIDNGDAGTGSITASVTGSTFAQDVAGSDGGAIDNGDGATVASTVSVADSTLTANTAPSGGAIGNAEASGLGSIVVSSTTLSANVASTGGGIDNSGGTGTVAAAGNLLADACAQRQSASGWTDAGYNAGDATCLNSGPGSVVSATVGSLLGPLAANGGPTSTLMPLAGNAGIALVPTATTVTLASTPVSLCPTTDQRGVTTVNGQACAAGAVQVSGPTFTSATHATFIKGAPGTFTARATGLPAPTFSETGALPAGVTLTAGGLLSGTPQTGGSFPVTLIAHNSSGPDAHQSFTLTVLAEGYWLVGGDGGIFTFGSATFHGSTGAMQLQRPVVAITPTANRGGYWLVASDGGIFAFGNAGFHGSIPGIPLAPAGTPGTTKRLNAPIVGMVPSIDSGGYFMVASDGGVFAFGDAKFVGSCPGIGGCAGSAVAVMPDATGNGYWVVTGSGSVYAFGDAPELTQPGPRSSSVTSAVRTPDGNGYWILYADGFVSASGSAVSYGSVSGLSGADPATAVFSTSDGAGYWVATANGSVHPFGDAAFLGDMSANHLNAPVIAASGF